jgi:hypothetical protein
MSQTISNTTFTWIISAVEVELSNNGLSQIVNKVHWRYKATGSDGLTAEVFNVAVLDTPNTATFIPYANLTSNVIIGWVTSTANVENLQTSLETTLQNIRNPPMVTINNPNFP